MKAILINPYTETISEVDHNGDYKQIYELMSTPEHKVDVFTIINVGNDETLFIDDNGLLKNPTHFFQWEGYHQPLAGCGLILGTDEEGDSAATKLTLDEVKAKVEWANDLAYEGSEQLPPGTINHPAFGEMFVIGSTPVFTKKDQ